VWAGQLLTHTAYRHSQDLQPDTDDLRDSQPMTARSAPSVGYRDTPWALGACLAAHVPHSRPTAARPHRYLPQPVSTHGPSRPVTHTPRLPHWQPINTLAAYHCTPACLPLAACLQSSQRNTARWLLAYRAHNVTQLANDAQGPLHTSLGTLTALTT